MSSTATPTVAFLGLGAMGFAMSMHLLRQGVHVVGFDVWKPTLERFEAAAAAIPGAHAAVADSPADAVRDAQVVLMMVANHVHVDTALFAEGTGAVHALKSGAAVVVCSTIPPVWPARVRGRLDGEFGRGDVRLVDAPVSGGVVGSASGTLSVMASCKGRDGEVLEAGGLVRGVLELLSAGGKRLFVIPGGLGAGTSAKALNQVMCGTHIVGGAEVMALAAVCGINTKTFYEGMKMADSGVSTGVEGPAARRYGWTWMFENRGPRMLDASLPISSATSIIMKDVGIIKDEETRLGVELLQLNKVHAILSMCMEAGLASIDDALISQWYLGLETERKDLAMRLAESGAAIIDETEQQNITETLLLAHALVNFMSAYETVLFAQALDLLGETQRKMWFEIISGAAGGSRVFSEVIPKAFAKMPEWKVGFAEYARDVFGRRDLAEVEALVSRAKSDGVDSILVQTALDFTRAQMKL